MNREKINSESYPMKNSIFIVLTILLTVFSTAESWAQSNSECMVQLENIDLKMNVLQFLEKNFFEKDNMTYHTESGTPINASEAFKTYGLTYNIYKETITEKDLKKETYYEGDDLIEIAQLYYTGRYTETDKIACYDNIWFNSLKILATNEDQFVALIAENRRTLENDFEDILTELGKKTKSEKTDFKNYELFTFNFEDYAIQVKKFKQSYRSESRIATPGEIVQSLVDLELLFIVNSINEKHINWLNKLNN